MKWHPLLLSNPQVASWYENVARRDRNVADVWLRNIARNLDLALGKRPADLLAMSQPELEEAVSACIDDMFDRELLGSTVQSFMTALSSFLAWHDREIKRSNSIPGARDNPNAEDEIMHEPATLRKVLATAEIRTRAMLLVMAHGGQRPQVIGRVDGSDGLRLRDLVEMTIEKDDVAFTKVPTRIEVSKTLSKNKKRFLFFLSQEGCEAIRAYLRTRIQAGEELTPDSPLFRPYGGAPRFLMRTNIGDAIRRAMRDAGVQGRPYSWRAYYAHHCQFAEAHAPRTTLFRPRGGM
ncbi:MAG: hypothetical protein ABR586_10160 [Thermoplasmatota archaeon]